MLLPLEDPASGKQDFSPDLDILFEAWVPLCLASPSQIELFCKFKKANI